MADKAKKKTSSVSQKDGDAKDTKPQKKFSGNIPSVKELFAAGVQFGHETRRWNPKMRKYLYDSKGGIHIIDITKSHELLNKAADFLVDAASKGDVVFVGTKKQAAQIVRDAAVEAGAHFVTNRWAGGLLTNFKKVKESFRKLRDLETSFEAGVEGRTKYEISLMKKDWAKLNRLYGGVKTLEGRPTAIVVVDAKYEKGAVREAKLMGIPVVGIVDSNTDPDDVNYVIPANDDAISSIKIIINTLSDAVMEGNGGKGVKHHLKDYSKFEVKIIKKEEESSDLEELTLGDQKYKEPKKVAKVTKSRKAASKQQGGGILEKVQKEKEKARKVKK
ncbi:MAG: hypothetical protein Kow0081_4150 [Candidatus Dojkabacteria bacterium]